MLSMLSVQCVLITLLSESFVEDRVDFVVQAGLKLAV